MKNLLSLLIIITIATSTLSGQNETIIKEWNIDGAKEIKIESNYGDVVIKVWDQDKVKLEGDVIINGNRENESLTINTKNRNGRLVVRTDTDFDKVPEMITVRHKDGTRIFYSRDEYDQSEHKNSRSISTGYDSDIILTYWVPRRLALTIETTYGNIKMEDSSPSELYVQSTYGTIDAIFSQNTSLPNFEIKSVYGEVDITLSQALKANIEMHTSYGEILTNLDIDVKHNRNTGNAHGEDITGILNGGGIDITLEATYGTVYLRGGE